MGKVLLKNSNVLLLNSSLKIGKCKSLYTRKLWIFVQQTQNGPKNEWPSYCLYCPSFTYNDGAQDFELRSFFYFFNFNAPFILFTLHFCVPNTCLVLQLYKSINTRFFLPHHLRSWFKDIFSTIYFVLQHSFLRSFSPSMTFKNIRCFVLHFYFFSLFFHSIVFQYQNAPFALLFPIINIYYSFKNELLLKWTLKTLVIFK